MPLADAGRRSAPFASARSPAEPLRTIPTLWHLLSLDAPTVATLWTAFVAAASGIILPVHCLIAMFLAVWILYAADRLLDAHPLQHQPTVAEDLELRHLFHHRHRNAFLCGILVATCLLTIFVPRLDPAALRLDLTLGLLLVGYFILIHADSGSPRLPKELAVGLFFSAAVFIPTVARQPALGLRLAPLAVLFAALCCLNCLYIYAWEHESGSGTPHCLTRIAIARLQPLACGIVLVALALAVLTRQPAGVPIALSATVLLSLDRRRGAISPTLLRASADLALLTPVLLLPWFLPHR